MVGPHDRHSRLQHRTWFPKMSMLLEMNAAKIMANTMPKFIYKWKLTESISPLKLIVIRFTSVNHVSCYDGIFSPSQPHKYLHNSLSKSHPPSYQVSDWSLKSQVYDRQLIDGLERMKEPKNKHQNRAHLSHRNKVIMITVYGKTKLMQIFMSTVFEKRNP